MPIQKFTDLTTWQEGHKLVLMIYKTTSNFPTKETYSLIDQMRRAAVSITSNIAEGFGRRSDKEKIQFLHTSLGSCYELHNQVILARDLEYMDGNRLIEIENKIFDVSRLLNGFIRSLKSD